MKGFKFKLEAVLKDRARQEERKLRDWSLSMRILKAMVEQRERLDSDLKRAIQIGSDLSEVDVSSSAQYALVDAFISGQKKRMEWKDRDIEKGSKFVGRKRHEYVQASQKRKSIEKLKEKKLNEYNEERKKTENKRMSDIYVMRSYGREEQ